MREPISAAFCLRFCTLTILGFLIVPGRGLAETAPVTVTITGSAPIETLSPSGDVTGVSESTVGTKLTLIRSDGANLTLQDAQGERYIVNASATDYTPPPPTPTVAVTPAPAKPIAPIVSAPASEIITAPKPDVALSTPDSPLLGETLDQCVQALGAPCATSADGTTSSFKREGYYICAYVDRSRAIGLEYWKVKGVFSEDEVNGFLKENGGDGKWVHDMNSPHWIDWKTDSNPFSRSAQWDPNSSDRFEMGINLGDNGGWRPKPGSTSSDEILKLVQQGQHLHDTNDYQGALKLLNQAIERDPNYIEGWKARAEDKVDLEDIPGALADYSKAIEIDPNDWWGYFLRGQAELNQGDFAGTIADSAKALQVVPTRPQFQETIIVIQGIAQYFQSDLTGAKQTFDKAIEYTTKDGEAYFERGLVDNALGQFDAAAHDFVQAAMLGDDIAPLMWWDAKVEGQHKDEADAGIMLLFLKGAKGTVDPSRIEFAKLLMGKTTAQQLQNHAGPLPAFFSGIALSQAGDKAGARQAFQQMLSQCWPSTPLKLEATRHLKALGP